MEYLQDFLLDNNASKLKARTRGGYAIIKEIFRIAVRDSNRTVSSQFQGVDLRTRAIASWITEITSSVKSKA